MRGAPGSFSPEVLQYIRVLQNHHSGRPSGARCRVVCLAAPNPSHFPKSRGFPFVSNYYAYWPPADHLLLGLRLLAPRAVEHEDFRQPAEMRDRLDELHGLSAVAAKGGDGVLGASAGLVLNHAMSQRPEFNPLRGSGSVR